MPDMTRRNLLRLGLGAGGAVALLPWGGRALASPAATAAGAVTDPGTPFPGEGGKLAYFGRMFPKLAPFTPDPDFDTASGLLAALADSMLEPGGVDDQAVGAWLTYFGQIVDHDITLDLQDQPSAFFSFAGDGARAPLLDPNGAIVYDYESKRLDLSQIYGGGPKVSPQLYEADGVHFVVVESNVNGVPDLPRNPDGTAILVEHRNDENEIISQLHFALLKFHNAIVDNLGYGFARARKTVTQYYQWIVLHQFLPQLCGQAVIDDMLAGHHRVYDPGAHVDRPVMPVEFSVAAYRQHSLPRNAYGMNTTQAQFVPDPPPLGKVNGRVNLFTGVAGAIGPATDLHGGRQLPAINVIDWANFVDALFPPAEYGVGPHSLQVAKTIIPQVGQSLFGNPPGTPLLGTGAGLAIGTDPGDVQPSGSNSLPFRDLIRGLAYLLPSGQDVAGAYGIPPISPATAIDPSQVPGFTAGTPLWYYILFEAQQANAGNPTVDNYLNSGTAGNVQNDRLGPVGGRIVTDVLLRVMQLDPYGQDVISGAFTPQPPIAPAAGQFTIADLLVYSGVAQYPTGSSTSTPTSTPTVSPSPS